VTSASKSLVVGVCLKENALWNHVTVLEHLALHAVLRGVRGDPRRVAAAAAGAYTRPLLTST